MSQFDSLSDTPPRRIVETEDMLSDDDDASSRQSRNYPRHYHRVYDYDYDIDDDDYRYCDRHRNNDDDDVSLISAPTKKRVRGIDPNDGRCLVENCTEHAGVIYCYCFPIYAPEQEPEMMDNIEWYWNIPYYSLNLQSSRNVFRAGASIAGLYRKHFWLLLPEESIIDQYHGALTESDGTWIAHRESFPDIPDRNDFEYRFIPISDSMLRIAISRQLRHPSFTDPPLSPSDFLVLVYPYDELPILKSHVHPRYVLLEAGRKLTKRVAQEKLTQLLEEYPLLKKVVQIYGAWTAKRPDNAMEDRSYNPPDKPRDDDDDDDEEEKDESIAPCENDEDENGKTNDALHGDKDASMKDIDTTKADDGMTTEPALDVIFCDQNQKKRKYSGSKDSDAIPYDKTKKLESDEI